MKMTDEVKAAVRLMRKEHPEYSQQTIADELRRLKLARVSRETIKAFLRKEGTPQPAEEPAAPPATPEQAAAEKPQPDEFDVPDLSPEEIEATAPAPAPTRAALPALPASAPVEYSLGEPAKPTPTTASLDAESASEKQRRASAEGIAEIIVLAHAPIFRAAGAPFTEEEEKKGIKAWANCAYYWAPEMSAKIAAAVAVGGWELAVVVPRIGALTKKKEEPARQTLPPAQATAAPAGAGT